MGARSTGSHPTTTKTDGHLLEYFRQNFGAGGGANSGPTATPTGLTATGGIISDYTDGPAVYRAHIFTSSGTFDVSAIGDFGDAVEYLVVGGGGGGGSGNGGGGGGAGGILHHPSYQISTSPGSYSIQIGAGGVGAPPAATAGLQGNSTTVSNPGVPTMTALGGGGGGGFPHVTSTSGGSGGGGAAVSPGTPGPISPGVQSP